MNYKTVAASLALMIFSSHASANIIFDGQFNTGDFSRYRQLEANGISVSAASAPDGITGHLERVLDPAGSGNSVMRATRLIGDLSTNGGGYRSEVSAFVGPMNSERWYSWGYFLPDSVKSINSDLVIAQIHDIPDKNESSFRYPTLALTIQADQVKLLNSYDYDRITSPLGTPSVPNVDYVHRELASWAVDTGKWEFLELHVKWAGDDTGFMEFWKNGVLLFHEEGHINTFDGEGGLWFKTGSYISPEHATWSAITTYSTGVKIGDGSETFQSMSVVPEPSAYLMIMIGLLCVGWSARVHRMSGRA